MIKRATLTILFAILGFFSFLAWAVIDSHICSAYPNLCVPRPGTCTEIDHCPTTLHMVLGLVLFVFGPPIAFAIAGFVLSKKNRTVKMWLACAVIAVLLHWCFTFVGVRLLKL
jgi:hypothetical protein